MDGFVSVGQVSDFPPGVLRSVDLGGPPVAVINLKGQFHAISGFCPHEGVTLTSGYGAVQESVVVCMLHSSIFDIETGDVLDGPADSGLKKYSVRIEDDEVFVSRTSS